MSFNRLNYDTCAYKRILSESTGPGIYQLNKPQIDCEQCYPYPPTVRLQSQGDSVFSDQSRIDTDSELIGITRKYSRCPTKKYIPNCPYCKCSTGYPCGQGVATACGSCAEKLKRGEMCTENKLRHWKDCFIPSEDTRFSNPVSNLRGTGFNRWEWLCLDPQEKIFHPYDFNINNRLIVKDNHRPIIPTPIDATPQLPVGGSLPCDNTLSTCGAPTQPPSVQWRKCAGIKQY